MTSSANDFRNCRPKLTDLNCDVVTSFPFIWWFRELRRALLGVCLSLAGVAVPAAPVVLKPDALFADVQHFNTMEDENVTNLISNAQSAAWLVNEIPEFDCPDREVAELYNFRWWSFRKHLEQTNRLHVLNEFLTRPQPVSSALGHQLAEGRWLHDQNYLDEYVRYWLETPSHRKLMHKYSSWLAWAVYQRYLVTGDRAATVALLDPLVADYQQWETEHLTNGLFWQFDVRDAMEETISGSRTNKNFRPTINSYMYGNAYAIARIAELSGRDDVAAQFDTRARSLRVAVESKLWNPAANFFEVRRDNGQLAQVREEAGFVPWMFRLPERGRGFEQAWTQLTDSAGFAAPYGLTTAERRSPFFRTHGYGHCEWDGAVWPFATSQTLTALANVLRDEPATPVSNQDYFHAFLVYVHSQHDHGKPYIGEYLDETTGQWINGKAGRSRYYNHSTFADLLITGVVGLVPRADDQIELHPLLPDRTWDWFCLDDVGYHGHRLTILWDREGVHFGRDPGFSVLVDGKTIAHSARLKPLSAPLP